MITISAGVTAIHADENAETAFERADRLLYTAKDDGPRSGLRRLTQAAMSGAKCQQDGANYQRSISGKQKSSNINDLANWHGACKALDIGGRMVRPRHRRKSPCRIRFETAQRIAFSLRRRTVLRRDRRQRRRSRHADRLIGSAESISHERSILIGLIAFFDHHPDDRESAPATLI